MKWSFTLQITKFSNIQERHNSNLDKWTIKPPIVKSLKKSLGQKSVASRIVSQQNFGGQSGWQTTLKWMYTGSPLVLESSNPNKSPFLGFYKIPGLKSAYEWDSFTKSFGGLIDWQILPN